MVRDGSRRSGANGAEYAANFLHRSGICYLSTAGVAGTTPRFAIPPRTFPAWCSPRPIAPRLERESGERTSRRGCQPQRPNSASETRRDSDTIRRVEARAARATLSAFGRHLRHRRSSRSPSPISGGAVTSSSSSRACGNLGFWGTPRAKQEERP
jgi:hypothetical protein